MSCRPVRSSGPGSRTTSPVGDAELGDQQLEDVLVDGLLDLEPHRRAEPAAQQLLLQRGEQVLGVVLLDLEVLVAGDPEGVHAEHLHAGEQPLEVLGDDVLERHEPLVADGHEPREDRRHLDPGEVLLAGLRVAHQHGEVERQPGDVRERVRRVDGQRRQHREDPLLEQLLALLLLVAGRGRPSAAARCPPWRARARSRRGTARACRSISSEVVLQICSSTSRGIRPGRGGHGDPGGDPALEAGHPHHEELVEVGGEDRQEPDPLEQRQARCPRRARAPGC